MNKVIEITKVKEYIKDGMTISVGGFMAVGTPESIIDAIVESNVRDLTIVCNDAGFPDKGVGKLIAKGQVKKLIASHIGLNPDAGKLMSTNELEVILTPQGTLAEQLRAAGAGLGGVLTPTGLGTMVEEGKEIIHIDGKDFLLEKPIKADVALIRGSYVDETGNVIYNATTRNFNPVMATAADLVICEAENLHKKGELDANGIHTPHIFVDLIVKG